MVTQKMSLANIKGKLSRAEMKNIVAGTDLETDGDIDGMSCKCKNGQSAGMASCDTCERYCSTDNNYGGKDTCD